MGTIEKDKVDHVMPLAPIDPSVCLRCRRTLSRADRRLDSVRDEARGACGYCAMPLTEQAKRRLRPPGVSTARPFWETGGTAPHRVWGAAGAE